MPTVCVCLMCEWLGGAFMAKLLSRHFNTWPEILSPTLLDRFWVCAGEGLVITGLLSYKIKRFAPECGLITSLFCGRFWEWISFSHTHTADAVEASPRPPSILVQKLLMGLRAQKQLSHFNKWTKLLGYTAQFRGGKKNLKCENVINVQNKQESLRRKLYPIPPFTFIQAYSFKKKKKSYLCRMVLGSPMMHHSQGSLCTWAQHGLPGRIQSRRSSGFCPRYYTSSREWFLSVSIPDFHTCDSAALEKGAEQTNRQRHG